MIPACTHYPEGKPNRTSECQHKNWDFIVAFEEKITVMDFKFGQSWRIFYNLRDRITLFRHPNAYTGKGDNIVPTIGDLFCECTDWIPSVQSDRFFKDASIMIKRV